MLEQLCKAKDDFDAIRRAYGQEQATFEEMKAAAIALLTLRQEAEIKRYGKAKTKVTPVAVASFMRS